VTKTILNFTALLPGRGISATCHSFEEHPTHSFSICSNHLYYISLKCSCRHGPLGDWPILISIRYCGGEKSGVFPKAWSQPQSITYWHYSLVRNSRNKAESRPGHEQETHITTRRNQKEKTKIDWNRGFLSPIREYITLFPHLQKTIQMLFWAPFSL